MKEKEQEQQEHLIAQYIDETVQDLNDSTYDEIPIPISYEGVVGDDTEGLVPYDLEKFKRGVKDYSYIAGAFSALRNSGMSEESVMQWLLGEVEVKVLSKQLESQEKITQIKADASIEEEL